MREIPGLTDVSSDLQIASPQLTLDIDRDRASAPGVNAQQVENALYNAFGNRQVSTIYKYSDYRCRFRPRRRSDGCVAVCGDSSRVIR